LSSHFRARRGSEGLFDLLPGSHEIAEAGEPALEAEFHRPDGPVALLADDDLGTPVDLLHDLLPLGHAFEIMIAGLLALAVVFLAEHEHDDVGVLLDRAGLAQVAELRPLVLAALDLAGKLRESDDRDRKLDRKSTRLNSSHVKISYAVFCLKKKKE